MNNYRLHISNSVEHHFIDLNNILYIKSDGNYCHAHLTDGTQIQNIPKQLGQIARIITHADLHNLSGRIIQVGRYHIVNTSHIQSIYTNKKQIVFDTIQPETHHHAAISVSSESLTKLCNYLSHLYPTQTNYPNYVNELIEDAEEELSDEDIYILDNK